MSIWSSVMSAIGLVVLLVALYYSNSEWLMYLMLAFVILSMFAVLFYMPMSISVKDGELNINRSFRIKSIPLGQIASIELCPPTMAERRICGSGGWFGYWGWFREPSIGKYFAYYGKASDCFLVTLKDKSKYLLGCEDPQDMVAYVKNHMN